MAAILDVQKSLLIAFLTISDRYYNFYFCEFFSQNGHWRPFWMCENQFRSHFWPFQIDMELFFYFLTKWPLSAILDFRKSLSIAFLAISDRSAILDVRNLLLIAFLAITDQYRTFFFSAAILDVRKSLSIAFLAISDLSANLGVRNSLSIAFLDISDRYKTF